MGQALHRLHGVLLGARGLHRDTTATDGVPTLSGVRIRARVARFVGVDLRAAAGPFGGGQADVQAVWVAGSEAQQPLSQGREPRVTHQSIPQRGAARPAEPVQQAQSAVHEDYVHWVVLVGGEPGQRAQDFRLARRLSRGGRLPVGGRKGRLPGLHPLMVSFPGGRFLPACRRRPRRGRRGVATGRPQVRDRGDQADAGRPDQHGQQGAQLGVAAQGERVGDGRDAGAVLLAEEEVASRGVALGVGLRRRVAEVVEPQHGRRLLALRRLENSGRQRYLAPVLALGAWALRQGAGPAAGVPGKQRARGFDVVRRKASIA